MNNLKQWFVFVCSVLVTLVVFFICDAILAGLIALVVMIFSKAVALSVFWKVTVILFAVQAVFTVPVVRKGVIEEKKGE